MMKKAIIKGEVQLNKLTFTPRDLINLKEALTFKSKAFVEGEFKTFLDYREDSDNIYLPINYFLERQHTVFSDYEVIDMRYDKTYKDSKVQSAIQLREGQKLVVNDLFRKMALGKRTGIIKSDVGSGKSIMMLYVAYRSKRKTLILVHKESLLKQFVKLIKEKEFLYNINLGIIQGQRKEVEGKDLVIGMINTVMKPKNKHLLEDFGLVMIDEVERVAADKFIKSLKACPAKNKLGWSATPKRFDGGKNLLYNNLGHVIVDASDFGVGGSPVKPYVVAIGHNFTIYKNGSEPKKSTPYFENTINDNSDRFDMIISLIKFLVKNPKRKILVMTNRVKIAKNVASYLNDELDIPSLALFGGVHESVMEKAKTDEIRVIVSNKQYISVGVSIDPLNTLIFMSFISGGLQQKIGRITRQDDGEERLVFDIVDLKSKLSVEAFKRKVRQYRGAVEAKEVFYYNWGSIFNKVNTEQYQKGDFMDKDRIVTI